MQVKDVMTPDPVTVGPDEPLRQVADLLATHGISGLPVVGPAGEPLGVVSEADLIAKEAGQPEARSGLGWRWLFPGQGDAEARAKLAARTAGEAMSSPAIVIRPETAIVEAARTMTERRVNRLPIVDRSGTLVGIVTRADLVRMFVRSDAEIRREIEHDVIVKMLWMEPSRVRVQVADGAVSLSGRVQTRLDGELLPRLVERVPGVVAVTSELTWEVEENPLPKAGSRSG